MSNDDKKQDFEEETERQFQARIKEERDEKERRERLRIQRLAASGKSPLFYTLDTIIEKCLMNQKSDRIEIDFYSLGLADNLGEVINVYHFFDQLKDAGCFKSFARSGNTWFIVTKPSIEKLREYKSSLKKKIGVEEKVVLQKSKNKFIRLPQFPADMKWENITIKFLNAQEVIVKIKTESKETTFQTIYEEMGFQDEKTKLPNKQWRFLKGLSETDGELSWKTSTASVKGKKQKQLLANGLKVYFQLNEPPFYSYRKEKAYKIKLTLIPEESSATATNQKDSFAYKKDNLGINDYIKEQSSPPEGYNEIV